MSQALLITNRDILIDIYSLNLKAYVDTNVSTKPTSREAIQLLDLNPNYDIIVTQPNIGDEKTLEEIIKYRKDNKLDIPIIVLGTYDGEELNVTSVQDIYDIKSVVKAAAHFLEITPKHMAEKPMPDYYPVGVKVISHCQKAPCSIYIRETLPGNNYVYRKVVEKDEACGETVLNLMQDEVKTVYVPSSQRLSVVNQSTQLIMDKLNNDDLAEDEAVSALESGHEILAEQVSVNQDVSEEMVELSKVCVKQMGNVMKKVPMLKNLIMNLVNNKAKYTYKHSMVAAYISSHIIKNISWGSKGQEEKLSFVFFFHDLFLAPILDKYQRVDSEEELLFSDELEDKEKEVILNHAKMASELVKNFPNLPIGAETIILQHHGSLKGDEFVLEYKDYISPLAKVVIISEAFAEKVIQHSTDGEEKIEPGPILEELYQRFPRESYKKILATLEDIKL